MTGYEALRTGAGWVDVSARGLIRVSGDDRARLLHAMTTNHVQQLKPGQGCYAYFLSAQGRILADVNILCREDHFLLDTEPETREKVYQHLDKFIIADDVTLEDARPGMVTLAVEGPAAREVLTGAGVPVPDAEYGSVTWNEALVARLSITGSPGFFLYSPAGDRDAMVASLDRAGATAATMDDAEIVRLENGRARYGVDLSERYLAQEANQSRALNFNKGCYLGQEIVERVRSRGQIHRRLMPLEIEGSQPPAAGTKLLQGENTAGEITSAAYSPAGGKVVALGYVRIDYKPGDVLQAGDAKAMVTAPVL